jgi:surface polysaccharide O-acyltransferase-like enzyme
MRLAKDTSDTIKLVSLWCSVLVCMNHAYTLDAPYAEMAGQPYAFGVAFVENAVKHGVVRMSTPFFFMVSAYLLFAALVRHDAGRPTIVPIADGYRGEIRKRLRSLLLPFALWSAWSFALLAAIERLPMISAMAGASILDQPPAALAETLLWNPVAHPLWFVRDLFLIALAWPLAWMLLRQRTLGLLVIAALCVPWFLWCEVRETRALVFFALGAWLAIHRPAIPRPHGAALIATGTLWLTGAALHALFIMRTGHTDPVYNNITILAELVTVWFGTQRLLPWLRRPWLMPLAAYTFFVYVAHEPIVTFARKAAVRVLGGEPALLFVAWIAAGAATLAICFGMAIALHRLLPAFYGLVTGGRGGKRAPSPAIAAGGVPEAGARVPA